MISNKNGYQQEDAYLIDFHKCISKSGSPFHFCPSLPYRSYFAKLPKVVHYLIVTLRSLAPEMIVDVHLSILNKAAIMHLVIF